MRTYGTVTRTYEREELIGVTCDLCGREGEGASWEESLWRENQTAVYTRVSQEEGESYEDCGSGQKYVVDICPTCFKEKLIPWLISQGAKIEREYWDY